MLSNCHMHYETAVVFKFNSSFEFPSGEDFNREQPDL